MPDRKIKNISALANALPIQVKNTDAGKDVIVQLSYGEEFWCPNTIDTNSIIIYCRKGFINVSDEQKPSSANYYETYPIDYWKNKSDISIVKDTTQEVLTPIDDEKSEPTVQRLKWEEKDIEFLKKHYPKNGVAYCAEKLGRPKHSVKKKVEALGLKKEDDKE